jgi:hypothetical protein
LTNTNFRGLTLRLTRTDPSPDGRTPLTNTNFRGLTLRQTLRPKVWANPFDKYQFPRTDPSPDFAHLTLRPLFKSLAFGTPVARARPFFPLTVSQRRKSREEKIPGRG